ncbi:MAG: RtcB family protein [Verrucomicrobiales bacterium]
MVTHHGSRGLGAHLFKRGQNAAEKHVRRAGQGIPEEAAWLPADSAEGEAYWEALQYAGRWARANHRCIHDLLADSIQAEPLWGFGCEHNFVWRRGDRFLHGKGATPAWRGEDGRPLLGLIPLNMAEPILLTIGADNADFLSFSPHGAGRNRSRRATFKRYRQGGKIDFDAMRRDLDRQTRGIDVRWFSGKPDITEGPGGYKPAAVVRKQIAAFGLASVAAEITPLGCLMAGGNLKRDEEDPLTPKQKRQLQHRADRRRDKQRLQRGGWDD